MRKKLWIALLAGATLLATTHAYANDLSNLIGKTVDNVRPLYIDGTRAAQDVLIVQDRSYLPVRSALTMFGYEVDYDDGKVLVNKKPKPEQPPTPQPQEPKEEPKEESKEEPKPTTSPVYVGMTTLEMIDQEITILKNMEEVFQQIVDSLMQSMSASNSSSSSNQLLSEYSEKLSYVKSELYFWETIREKYLERPQF